MTPLDLAAIEKAAKEATPGPWEADGVRNDGDYGGGEDVHSGFESYQVLAEVRGELAAVVDTINASHRITEVHDEFDEESHHAWDEQGRRNARFIALTNPATILALCARIREPAKVKPLEWADSDWAMVSLVFGGHYEVFHKASTVSKQGMQVAYVSTSDDDEPAILGYGKTLNDAQALAQTHHDSRIRSALI